MVEYIGSNDDAGNLGLYAGIGAVTFAGGAALAYRATSPIYKNGDKKKGPALANITKAEDMASGGKKGFLGKLFANPMEGALNQIRADAVNSVNSVMNTKRQLKKDKAGMEEVDNNFAAQQQAEKAKKAEARAIGRKQGDMDYVRDMMQKNPDMTPIDLHQELQKAKPNTLISASDVQKRYDRHNKQLSAAAMANPASPLGLPAPTTPLGLPEPAIQMGTSGPVPKPDKHVTNLPDGHEIIDGPTMSNSRELAPVNGQRPFVHNTGAWHVPPGGFGSGKPAYDGTTALNPYGNNYSFVKNPSAWHVPPGGFSTPTPSPTGSMNPNIIEMASPDTPTSGKSGKRQKKQRGKGRAARVLNALT